MNIFTPDDPWITEDNRRLRPVSRTTAQSMNHKHAAMLPAPTLQDRTVLDLGCCIGGTGYWALKQGAREYTGVEVQPEYVRIARRLFAAAALSPQAVVHEADLATWLEGMTRRSAADAPPRQWDVVLLAGVLYGYIDPLYVLRMACELARECVVIDMLHPRGQPHADAAYIEVIPLQRMVVATHDDLTAAGAGCRITPAAQDALMANYGFHAQRMEVERITDTHDAYNDLSINHRGGRFPMRYITRYLRGTARAASVNEEIASGKPSLVTVGLPPPDNLGAPQ